MGMVVVLAEEVLVAPVRVAVALVLLLALVPEDQPNTERPLINATHSCACGHGALCLPTCGDGVVVGGEEEADGCLV